MKSAGIVIERAVELGIGVLISLDVQSNASFIITYDVYFPVILRTDFELEDMGRCYIIGTSQMHQNSLISRKTTLRDRSTKIDRSFHYLPHAPSISFANAVFQVQHVADLITGSQHCVYIFFSM